MAKLKKPKPFYHNRAATPEPRGSPRDAIQAAMQRWARPGIPDYASFGGWLADKLTIKDRGLVLPQVRTSIRNETIAYVQALLDSHQEYVERIRTAKQAHATTGESYRLLFSSFKLPIPFFGLALEKEIVS